MARRASGVKPSPRISAAADAAGPPRRAVANAACSSRSGSTRRPCARPVQEAIGNARLGKKDIQSWDVRVPFHEGRDPPETCQGIRIELPYLGPDPRAMVVYENREPISIVACMASHMDLLDRLSRQSVHVGGSVEGEVVGGDVDIVHVTEQPTAGSADELGQELGLRDGRMPEAEIARGVLDEELPTERELDLIDMPAQDLQAFFRVRQREEMVQIRPACHAPREVLRHEHGLDALDQGREPPQMVGVETMRTAEREPHTVEGDRIVTTDQIQAPKGRAASD